MEECRGYGISVSCKNLTIFGNSSSTLSVVDATIVGINLEAIN